jgi:ectoine hydroxylase-related dioxygenase (phytanoyl-CoA dioxygenase family)
MTITISVAAAAYVDRLITHGWCIVPDALPTDLLLGLDADLAETFAHTPFCRGRFYGETTQRFGRLLTRSQRMPALVQHRLILDIVETILTPHCDCIGLNVTQAIAVHPGAPAQAPHRDGDMWRGPVGTMEYLVNVMWPLTDFHADNGATMIWPRSHGAAALDPEPDQDPIIAQMPPGSALLFLGSTLHGAGANRSDRIRRGLVIGYALGWLKPYENPWLAYPPAIARTFSPDLAALVGYRQHRPNLGNYEGRCPSILLGERLDAYLGAIDALRPDQQTMVDAFALAQGTMR